MIINNIDEVEALDEKMLGVITHYATQTGSTGEGDQVTLYAACGSFISWDADFLDWLCWTRVFGFVVLQFNGCRIMCVTSAEAWQVYTMSYNAEHAMSRNQWPGGYE